MMAKRSDLEKPYGPVIIGVAWAGCLFLLLPIACIVLFSFSDTVYFRWPPQALSLRWYANFFASEQFMRAAMNSLIIAVVVTSASLLVGLPAALALVRGNFPGRNLIASLLLSPLIVPGVVTGMAFLVLFANLRIEFGLVRLLIGLFIFALPFAVRALVANLIGLDSRTEEAGRNLGASPWRCFLHVTLPQLKPGLLAGAIFVFVEAIDNFSISVFLVDTQTTTLPVEAYFYIRDFDDPTVAAMAAILIAFSAILVFAVERLIGFEKFLRMQ